MTKHSSGLILCVPDPFDGSAEARLSHMGLLDRKGQPDRNAMQGFTRIFSGLFFDDLCDFYDDTEKIQTIHQAFQTLAERQEHQRMFLLLSLQYDYLRKPLPDPVWWLSGHAGAVTLFMSGFLTQLEERLTAAGLLKTAGKKGAGM